MNINFAEALRSLPPGTTPFTIANTARPPADYLGAQLLPERARATYEVSTGNLSVRPTLAGLAAMDSPYPQGGAMSISTFLQNSAKIANHVPLSEQTLRTLQDMLMRMQNASAAATIETVQRVALNFLDKVIIQAHFDTMEVLRWQALSTGALAWQFGTINLAVDYGLPSGTFLSTQTGNNFYGGSTSKFWDDVRAIQQFVSWRLRWLIVSPVTLDLIISNSVNNIEVTSANPTTGVYTVRRLVGRQGNTQLSSDARDTITLVAYGRGGEILDPANPGGTKRVPFLPDGYMVGIATPDTPSAFVIESDATEEPSPLAVGYTHLAPTVEGGGVPGRWANLFTPELEPWSLIGRGVTNGLPVIEIPAGQRLLCVGRTNLNAN